MNATHPLVCKLTRSVKPVRSCRISFSHPWGVTIWANCWRTRFTANRNSPSCWRTDSREDDRQPVFHDSIHFDAGGRGPAYIRLWRGALGLGPAPHSRQRLHRQRRRADDREVESPAAGDPEGTPAVRLHGQQRRVRDASDGVSGFGRGHARRSLGGRAVRSHLSWGRFVPIPARPRAGGRVLADPERPARRGSPAHRYAARRRGHLSAKRDEAIFEIVNQLNRGSHLIASVEERERVADLNLIAGQRAKSAIAYDAALKYLRAGSALLTEETWQRNYELVFSIERLMAECEMLTAEMVAAEDRMLRLSQRARNRHDPDAAGPEHHHAVADAGGPGRFQASPRK